MCLPWGPQPWGPVENKLVKKGKCQRKSKRKKEKENGGV